MATDAACHQYKCGGAEIPAGTAVFIWWWRRSSSIRAAVGNYNGRNQNLLRGHQDSHLLLLLMLVTVKHQDTVQYIAQHDTQGDCHCIPQTQRQCGPHYTHIPLHSCMVSHWGKNIRFLWGEVDEFELMMNYFFCFRLKDKIVFHNY